MVLLGIVELLFLVHLAVIQQPVVAICLHIMPSVSFPGHGPFDMPKSPPPPQLSLCCMSLSNDVGTTGCSTFQLPVLYDIARFGHPAGQVGVEPFPRHGSHNSWTAGAGRSVLSRFSQDPCGHVGGTTCEGLVGPQSPKSSKDTKRYCRTFVCAIFFHAMSLPKFLLFLRA